MTAFTLSELAGLEEVDLGVSAWATLEQSAVDTYADVVDDRHWLHNEPLRASSGPFGGPVAHGILVLAATQALMWTLYRVSETGADINYGFNRVRFPSPAYVGEPFRVGVTLIKAEPHKSKGVHSILSVTAFTGEPRAQGSRVLCVAEQVLLHLPPTV